METYFKNFLTCYITAISFLTTLACGSEAFTESGAFRHHPSIQLELVVAEPDILDPVALCFDASGNMYVVEMRDYPYGKGLTGSPGGTIRKLLFNASGTLIESHIFAEKLSFPTSITPFKNGVIVAAGDLIYLQDTNGDHVADVRQTLLTGFNQSVTDSNLSGLRWGLDNRLHGVNGGNNGSIKTPQSPEKPLPLSGADFAWNPFNQSINRTFHTGGGFGLVFDHYGRSFTPHNINHIKQRILPVAAMERFHGFPSLKATVGISDHGGMARIYPISKAQTRVNHPEQAGYFSSSGGMGMIPGTFASPSLKGSVLVCDVVGNLVHRDVMHPNGPVYEARRASEEQSQEFIASRDITFRPVGLETGPDGSLYLMDMQRAVIEHPDYIPEQIIGRYQIREGEDRGRIYRVSAIDSQSHKTVSLMSLTSAALFAELGHPNDWVRRTAQRLIVERQDISDRSLFHKAQRSEAPLARIHTLWCMDGLALMNVTDLRIGLTDPHPGIRAQTLLLLETHPEWWNQLWPLVQSLSEDSDPMVRFQTALTLGCHPHPDNDDALFHILIKDINHEWSRRAVLSSLRKYPANLLADLWKAYPDNHQKQEFWNACISEVAYVVGARLDAQTSPDFEQLLTSVNTDLIPAKINALAALLEGAKSGAARSSSNASIRASLKDALENIASHPTLSIKRSVWAFSQSIGFDHLPGFNAHLQSSLITALDPNRSLHERQEAIELLGLSKFEDSGRTLLALLNGLEPLAIQQNALNQLGKYSNEEVALGIINHWREIGPGLRPLTIQTLLRRRLFHLPLLEAIERGQIGLGELNLDLEQRRLLRENSTSEVKKKASALFGDEEYSNRKDLLDEWLSNMPENGNIENGKIRFTELCAQCHQSRNLGVEVGPNLTDMSHRSVEDLAFNILDPNMAINPGFIAYEAETGDGELLTGIITSESPDSVTLLSAQGIRREVSRSKLLYLRSGGLSLMPEGLEEQLTPNDLRDLISFLQTSD